MRFILVHPFAPLPLPQSPPLCLPIKHLTAPWPPENTFRQSNGSQSRNLYGVVRDVLRTELQLGNSLMNFVHKIPPKKCVSALTR